MKDTITKKVYLYRKNNEKTYYCFDNDISGYTLVATKWVTFEVEEEKNSYQKEIEAYKLKIKRIKEESNFEINMIEAKIKAMKEFDCLHTYLPQIMGKLILAFHLIQDSWRMFELAVDNDLRIRQADESAEIFYYSFDEKEQEGRWISVSAKHKDHESKVAAARYAIAMALVKLAESKNVE